VEVGSPEDVSLVLRRVGASRTPFAVYSGGHASNPGFSSTPGVHISLKRFNQTELSPDGKTVTIGFGLVRNSNPGSPLLRSINE
jgi:FAD/FMN-containing dehydrogenase